MFAAVLEELHPGGIIRYQLTSGADILTWGDVLASWREDCMFRQFFNRLLADSEFAAFRWETPPLTRASAARSFEFVLIDTPEFARRQTDRATFADFYRDSGEDAGVVVFPNLGGDATLVVPSPATGDEHYGHLGAFVRGAPAVQADALWRVLGRVLGEALAGQPGDAPRWVSTAGGGVAWLHLRIDQWPKYYAHDAYRRA